MQIKVKIGAALDGDLEKILFEPMTRGAKRARGVAKAEVMSARDEQLAILKGKIAKENALVRQQKAHELAMARDAARQEVREKTKAVQDIRRVEKQAAQERERENQRILAQAARDARDKERILATAERMASRAAARERQDREKGIRSFASSASGTATGLVRRGVGVAADIARGAGVSMDVGAGVKKRIDLESKAVALANAGYVEGEQGPQGIKQDPRAIMADIQRTGEKYGIGQDDIGEALDKFVGKTGELQTGRDMLESFAKVAKATGASMEDIAGAAGAISNKLGDVPDKAGAIEKVMLAIAGQGKVGAVEIKDLATQMEKLTGQASKFQSNAALKNKIGTDTGANIAMLGVLAQAARKTEKGSAAQATQSAMAFVRDLTGQVAIKRIGAKTIFSDDKKMQLRDPQEIIKDILSKTKGDQSKLSYLMSNQNSRSVVNSFLDPYMKAYNATKGGAKEKDEAGRAAVDEAFKTLKEATLTSKSQDEAVAQAMDTTATKVEQFQQKLDRVVGDMADQVIPALMKLAPVAVDAAGGLSKVVTWAATNPMQALGAAMGAGLAKAVADSVAAGVASKMTGALAGNLPLAGLAVTTLAIASVGLMAIDHVTKQMDDESRKKYSDEADAMNKRVELRRAQAAAEEEKKKSGTVSPETAAKLTKAQGAVTARRDDLERRIAEGEKNAPKGSVASRSWDMMKDLPALTYNSLLSYMRIDASHRIGDGKTIGDVGNASKQASEVDAMKAELTAIKAAMNNVNTTLGGTLKVTVEGGAPALPGATTGP